MTTTRTESTTTNKDYADASLSASSTATTTTTNSARAVSPDSLTPMKEFSNEDTSAGLSIVSPDEKSTTSSETSFEFEGEWKGYEEQLRDLEQKMELLEEETAELGREYEACSREMDEIENQQDRILKLMIMNILSDDIIPFFLHWLQSLSYPLESKKG